MALIVISRRFTITMHTVPYTAVAKRAAEPGNSPASKRTCTIGNASFSNPIVNLTLCAFFTSNIFFSVDLQPRQPQCLAWRTLIRTCKPHSLLCASPPLRSPHILCIKRTRPANKDKIFLVSFPHHLNLNLLNQFLRSGQRTFVF